MLVSPSVVRVFLEFKANFLRDLCGMVIKVPLDYELPYVFLLADISKYSVYRSTDSVDIILPFFMYIPVYINEGELLLKIGFAFSVRIIFVNGDVVFKFCSVDIRRVSCGVKCV